MSKPWALIALASPEYELEAPGRREAGRRLCPASFFAAAFFLRDTLTSIVRLVTIGEEYSKEMGKLTLFLRLATLCHLV
jgi:hypothetical protein